MRKHLSYKGTQTDLCGSQPSRAGVRNAAVQTSESILPVASTQREVDTTVSTMLAEIKSQIGLQQEAINKLSMETQSIATQVQARGQPNPKENRPQPRQAKKSRKLRKSGPDATGSRDAAGNPRPARSCNEISLTKEAKIHPRNEDIGAAITTGLPPNTSDRDSSSEEDEWTTVARKKANVQKKAVAHEVKARNSRDPAALVRKRTPKTEAVSISGLKEGKTYAEVMRRVVSHINLEELGVDVVRSRFTRAGAILFEVNTKDESQRLAGCLTQRIGEDAEVVRPTRRTPILIVNIPEWMSSEEVSRDVKSADAEIAGLEVTVRENPGGGRFARLDVPMAVAARLAELGSIRVGWSRCKIKLLERKDPVCYRCQKAGHTAARCSSPAQEKKCFRCHLTGHLAKECQWKKEEGENNGRGYSHPKSVGSTAVTKDANDV